MAGIIFLRMGKPWNGGLVDGGVDIFRGKDFVDFSLPVTVLYRRYNLNILKG